MKWTAVIIVSAMLLFAIPASAQGTLNISRSVIANGGAASSRLSGAIGQPVAGTMTTHGSLCSGFWCGFRTPSGIGLQPPSGASLKLIYRLTFGQLGIGMVALVLICLVTVRWIYNHDFHLRGDDGSSDLSSMVDRSPGGGGSDVFRRAPIRDVAGPGRDRWKPG